MENKELIVKNAREYVYVLQTTLSKLLNMKRRIFIFVN